MTSTQMTSTVQSGDVTLFIRKFGAASGNMPLLILHGGNYYDSADWIDVGEELAGDREIAAFDARGFGNSGWSASKDYGFASALNDIRAVLGHLGWERAIIVGHSRGGSHALLAAARAPEIAAGLILVDYSPALGFGPPGGVPAVDGSAPVFPTVEAALDSMTRFKPVPLTSETLARALQFLEPVDGGFRLAKRDPCFMNHAREDTPIIPRGGFDELADTRCPVLVIRATKSPIFKPEDLTRLASVEGLALREIESGHDVVGETPEAFVTAVTDWLFRERV